MPLFGNKSTRVFFTTDVHGSTVVFKKFIVKARLDYLGTGGKAQAVQGPAQPATPKAGA